MNSNLRRFANIVLLSITAAWHFSVLAAPAAGNRDRSFDSGWRFLRADAPGAEAPAFDDSTWRALDLPHDWSIEDLPSTNDAPPSPFNPAQSAGGAATGYVVGGTGWYRKHFTLPDSDSGKSVTICFDGVYMNADVWLNGQHLGDHPYGYTPFVFDLTPFLKPAGQENVLAVRVRNEGKNSRWYSGSGIYRHTWLSVTDPIHVATWGVFVTTPEISKDNAVVKIATEIGNGTGAAADLVVRTRLLNPKGKTVQTVESKLHFSANERRPVEQTVEVRSPKLWSLDSPDLYSAEIEIVTAGKTLDKTSTHFGIRKIEVDAENGFRLNGQMLKFKGGCMHHDNGPLGAAAIDRAEERRIELMKANGFNAIRTSHNPPSSEFLDACDRLGMLVIDEAFDCWNEAKNPQDYHLYFKDWAERDIASMIRRDRNHPSVIMWSIGNEIPEQHRAEATSKMLREAVLSHDSTRPITQGVCVDWRQGAGKWNDYSDTAFLHLDVGGYNYLPNRYESDHARNPKRVMMGTESYPKNFFDYWSLVEKQPYIIGDFVWTAWDYLGETGIGNAIGNGANRFPWFDAWCGDIDLCGFEKPQHYFRAVVWGDSKIALAVHAPMPDDRRERVSGWGWPDERQSWTWPGSEGKPLDVTVYSSCQSVRLELDGKEIATNPVNKMVARFKVPYQPGELRAVGLTQGKRMATASLRTAAEPAAIRLTADRSSIRADRNDLSYITVEVVDRRGIVDPNATIPIHFTVTGAGELAATGSPAPNDASSFHVPVRNTYQGRCLAILRPRGGSGKITVKAEADGLKAATVFVTTH